ncbi:MAG TPA: iron-sulfur cluster assembly scaffold protein [Micropepsaceae bacterium]|jgi:NifU-like protein involved in Fe-S cluster formation|nr:iron-sulfur cluster assembly scaffold protein [Micropepsaceae bacterium]
MSDPLYAKDLLRLAANAIGAGRLTPCDAEGSAHNPTCGDRVSVTLRLDQTGHITDMAHDTKACVLAQASASILGAHLSGADEAAVQSLRTQVSAMLREGGTPDAPFTEYSVLAGAATFRNRHSCVLLPIDAVLDAFAQPEKPPL